MFFIIQIMLTMLSDRGRSPKALVAPCTITIFSHGSTGVQCAIFNMMVIHICTCAIDVVQGDKKIKKGEKCNDK